MIKWLLLTLLVIGKVAAQESRLVNTEQGPVRGYKEPGDDVFVFYSIPYATAPSGNNKYKAPLPPPNWTEPFEAVDKKIICRQMNNSVVLFPGTLELDDCLIANVYVPDVKRCKLPVLIQIHGGAYLLGRGDIYTPKNFIRQAPMVVVTFNYRLGPQGFLCLGTPDAPGNAGMKDQVALLRWVKKNIASFGGNPDDVTVSGYSAGSSSVDLLLLSPMTKGLFNKAIPESGASLSVFSIQVDPIERAKKYAKMINFTSSDDVYELENFYKTVPRDVLYSINLQNLKNSSFVFSPCVERDLGEERFLDDSPINILKKGRQQKLPMLFGLAEMEGLFRIPQFDIWKNDMNNKFSDFLPADLRFESEQKKEEIAQKVKTFYFGDQPVGLSPVFQCTQISKIVLQFSTSPIRSTAYRAFSLTKMTTHTKWKIEKNRIQNLPLEDKRKLYRTSEYIILDHIHTWLEHARENEHIKTKIRTQDDLNEFKKFTINPKKNVSLSEKVSIFKGDITKLEIDAIVNAANSRLKAGGGVDGAIHRAAGPLLQDECNSLGGCPTGEAKVTSGYDLPAKYVIHTVGPQDGSAAKLQSCYDNCLALKGECHFRSIAFPCISTGIYGFPNRQAAHIALRTARKFLESHDDMQRVIFCTFMPVDFDIYETLMQLYFPVEA